MKKILSNFKWSIVGLLMMPAISLAQLVPSIGGGTATQLTERIMKIVNYALGIVGIVAVIVIFLGAIKLMTGGEEGIKEGKGYITYGIVGLVIAGLAMAIVNWIIGALVL